LARALWTIAALTTALAAVAVAVFVLRTMDSRIPYWGEAEVLFEASRVRHGWPLFVDPLVGALEHGPPPSRYYVTYPPLLTYALAVVPSCAATLVGRLTASIVWFGTLGWIARSGKSRATGAYAAAFVAGLWLLANFATVARPDAFACAIAGWALVRSVRAREVDPVAAAALVLAAWLKPTVLGIPCGALLTDAVVHRRGNRLAIAAGVCALIGAVFYATSGGQLFAHVVRSNAQPMRTSVWLEHVPARLPFFLPLFAAAGWNGLSQRRDSGLAIGCGALAVSAGWAVLALAKTGSAANYWMEPCVASVVLLAHAAGPFVFGGPSLAQAAFTALHAVYTDVASVRASFEEGTRYRAEAAALSDVRRRCEGPIAADTQGIELALDGRILVPTYQMAWRVRSGAFPAGVWKDDLALVKCYVIHSHALDVAPELASFVTVALPNVDKVGPFEVRYIR
jgi:hypothetical protein